MIYESVAREVQAQNIPQKKLAEAAGIHPVKVSLTLSGKRRMTPEEFMAYCKVLGKSPDYFSGIKEEECKNEGAEENPGEGWTLYKK